MGSSSTLKLLNDILNRIETPNDTSDICENEYNDSNITSYRIYWNLVF